MKVWNYVVIMITIAVLLDLAGLLTNTSPLTAIGFARDPVTNNITYDFDISHIFNALFGTEGITTGLLIGIGAALTVGFFTRGRLENFILLPFITGTLAGFTTYFVLIIKDAMNAAAGQTWIQGLLALILVPFTFGYVLALIEFFRGSD